MMSLLVMVTFIAPSLSTGLDTLAKQSEIVNVTLNHLLSAFGKGVTMIRIYALSPLQARGSVFRIAIKFLCPEDSVVPHGDTPYWSIRRRIGRGLSLPAVPNNPAGCLEICRHHHASLFDLARMANPGSIWACGLPFVKGIASYEHLHRPL